MRACEQTVLYVIHAVGVYSVYTSIELSALRSGNPKPHALTEKLNKQKISFTALRQILKNDTTMNYNFCHEEFCHDEDDEDEVCGKPFCHSL